MKLFRINVLRELKRLALSFFILLFSFTPAIPLIPISIAHADITEGLTVTVSGEEESGAIEGVLVQIKCNAGSYATLGMTDGSGVVSEGNAVTLAAVLVSAGTCIAGDSLDIRISKNGYVTREAVGVITLLDTANSFDFSGEDAIQFSHKITVEDDENGDPISGATIDTGATACIESGTLGVYLCPITALEDDSLAFTVSADGYTDGGSIFANRSLESDPQDAQTIFMIADDLIGHWKFDEGVRNECPGGGSDICDSSGNGHVGILTDGTDTWSADPDNGAPTPNPYAIRFDNIDNVGGHHADMNTMDFGDTFTVSAWIKPNDLSNIGTIMGNAGVAAADGFKFYVNSYNTTDGKLFFETANGSIGDSAVSTAGAITNGRWQLVTVVVNKTSGSATLYVNGVDVTEDSLIKDDFNTNGFWSVGSMADGGWLWSGEIDDMRAYNRELSGEEILDLVNGWEYSPFDGGNGTEGSPYEISTCDGIVAINDDLNAAYVVTSNLNCSSVGNDVIIAPDPMSPFIGLFDGGGHTITIDIDSTADHVGLFGNAGSDSEISDVRVAGSVTSTGDAVGGVVGYGNNMTIDRVVNTATVRGANRTGGIIGEASNVAIRNVYNKGNVSLSDLQIAGGIAGYIDASTGIINSYNYGTIGSLDKDVYNVGGIIGWRHYNGTNIVENTFNVGFIQSTDGGATSKGAIFGADIPSMASLEPGYTNNFFDVTSSGTGLCGYTNSSVPINPITGQCEGVNEANSQPNYFKTNFDNAPMSGIWDTGIWEEVPGGYPALQSIIGDEDDNSPFGGGDGSEEEPLQVNNCNALVSINDSGLGLFYELTSDLNCSSAGNTVMIGDTTNGFTGSFDGGGHKITIAIDNTSPDTVGLFRMIDGGTVKNLWVAGTIDAGSDTAGGLAGYAKNGAIIQNIASTVSINGAGTNFGGIVGYAESGTAISDVYWNGTILGGYGAGGIAGGLLNASIERSYTAGSVTASSTAAGGIAGQVFGGGSSVSDVFAAVEISAPLQEGGIIGNYQAGTLDNTWFDTVTSGLVECMGNGTGIPGCDSTNTPSEFKSNDDNAPFKVEGTPMWDFEDVWETSVAGYPSLRAIINDELATSPFSGGDGTGGDPYQIRSCAGITAINDAGLDKSYILNQSINCTAAGNSVMIGTNDNPFTGDFNGSGHKVTVALTSTGSSDNYIGLFRVTLGGTIHSLRVGGTVTVSTQQGAGSLIGRANDTYIYQVTSDATVSSDYFNDGGLIGEGNGIILEDSYFSGSVTGNSQVGGLIGVAENVVRVSRTYSSGAVHSDMYHNPMGGLVGRTAPGSTVTIEDSFAAGPIDAFAYGIVGQDSGTTTYENNFFDMERTSSESCSNTLGTSEGMCEEMNAGGVQPDYFTGNDTNKPFVDDDEDPVWDFDETWIVQENGYPLLGGIDYPAPVAITTPANGSVSLDRNPVVDWGNSTTCQYHYGDGDLATADCSLNGADISDPETSFANHTLTIFGTDGIDDLEASSTFFYYPTTQGDKSEPDDLPWTEHIEAGLQNWQQIAISANGQRIAAAVYGGTINVSSDGGGSWTATSAPTGNWQIVKMSATGQYIVASGSGSYVYISNDYGATWRELSGGGDPSYTAYGHAVTISADGKNIVIGDRGHDIMISHDYGVTWTAYADSESHGTYVMVGSADGQTIAGISDNRVIISHDGGVSWDAAPDAPGGDNPYALAISADGQTIVTGGYHGYLYISDDSGESWDEKTDLGDNYWYGVAVSADGSTIVTGTSFIIVSNDQGDTWTTQTDPGGHFWVGFAVIADGTKITAVAPNSGIFITDAGDDDGGGEDVDFDDGDGSEGDPYMISTCRQLQSIGQVEDLLGLHYRLAQNIDCSATSISDSEDPDYDADLYNDGYGFDPIGDSENPFSGFLSGEHDEGGSYEIQNLSIGRDNDYLGLFGVTNGAVIGHVSMVGAEINGAGVFHVGGFIGSAHLTPLDHVSFSGEVYGTRYVGGLVGEFYGDDEGSTIGIDDSSMYGTVTAVSSEASRRDIGGFAGSMRYGYIDSSSVGSSESYATIDGSAHAERIGGFVGMIEDSTTISDSVGYVHVTGFGTTGGLVGEMEESMVLSNSVFGTVNGGTDEESVSYSEGFGGMIGISVGEDTINENSAEVDVNVIVGSGYVEGVGGLVGSVCWDDSDCNFNDNDSSGSVTVTFTTPESEYSNLYCTGGLAGCLYGYDDDSDDSGTFTGNTSSTDIEIIVNGESAAYHSVEEVGGLFGDASSAIIENSSSSGSIWIHATGPTHLDVDSVGGLVGDLEDFKRFSDNYSSTNITIDTTNDNYDSGEIEDVGGLIGYSEGDDNSSIKRAYATGSVSATGFNINSIGGLVGYSYDSVSESYAEGEITITPYADGGYADNIGGLIGYYDGNDDEVVANTYATGSIHVNPSGEVAFVSADQIGGLIGNVGASAVARSYSTGAVAVLGYEVSGVGGLVGQTESTISESFTTSHVSITALDTNDLIGGLVGDMYDTDDLSGNYFDMLQTGMEGCANVSTTDEQCRAVNTGIPGDETDETYFINNDENPPLNDWNFDVIWSAEPDEYPKLQMLDIFTFDGLGTEENPYLVDSCEALDYINDDLDKHYLLTDNINCNDFDPIGDEEHPFTGSFDGDGYYIALQIDVEDGLVGLFARMDGATVEDLVLAGSFESEGGDYVGALAGIASDSYIYNVEVYESYTFGDEYVGGLVGLADNGTKILKSATYASTEGSINVGGLAGAVFEATVIASGAYGSVSGVSNVGGLVGNLDLDDGDESFSRNISEAEVDGQENVGGLIGYATSAYVHDSYATGGVEGYQNVGGLIGQQSMVVLENVYSTGSVLANGYTFEDHANQNIGGLVGYSQFNSSIANSWTASEVRTITGEDGGYIYDIFGDNTTHIAAVTGFFNDDLENFNNNFWDLDRSGQPYCDGVHGGFDCTSVNPEGDPQPYYFQGNRESPPLDEWNFTDIWGDTEGYPYLRSYAIPVSITTGGASEITEDSAVISGTVNEDPVEYYGAYGVAYVPHGEEFTDESDYQLDFPDDAPIQSGPFTVSLTELACGTAYDYKVFIATEGPWAYADNVETFTTSDCSAPAEEIIAHWKFDEESSGGEDSIIDSSTHHNDGTPFGNESDAPEPSTDIPETDAIEDNVRSLYFDGSGGFMRVPGLLGENRNISVSTWLKVDPDLEAGEAFSIGNSVLLRMTPVAADFMFYDGEGWQQTVHYLDATQWHLYTYTFDDDSDTQAVYIDGMFVGSTDHTGSIDYDAPDGNNRTEIGAHPNESTYFYKGFIDDTRVYSYALSSDEVADLAGLDGGEEDTVTETPTLSSPQSSHSYRVDREMTITFSLPEDMLTNSLGLVFTPHDESDPIVIHLRDAESGHNNTFRIMPSGGITDVEEVLSASADSIPVGTYTVALSYQDAAGNAQAVAVKTNVKIIARSPSGGGSGGRRSSHSGGGGGSSVSVAPTVTTVSGTVTSSGSPSDASVVRTLRYGMIGDDVLALQKWLNAHRFVLAQTGDGSPGHETKNFLQRTLDAVKRYQVARGLQVDGVVGPITRGVMTKE